MEIRLENKARVLLYFIMFFILARPVYFSNIFRNGSFERTVWSVLEAGVYLCIFVFWTNHRKISALLVMTALLYGIIIISTFYNGGNVYNAIRSNIGYIFMVMLVDNESEERENLWQACIIYLSVMIIVDIIVSFLFMNGMANAVSLPYGYNVENWWFFSTRNTFGMYVLYWMFFKADYDYERLGRLSVPFYVLYLASLWAMISMECITSTLTTVILFVMLHVVRFVNKYQPLLFNIYLLLALVLAANLVFVVLNNIDGVSGYLIKDVLKASETFNGRTPIWKSIMEWIALSPILGFGYIYGDQYGDFVGFPGIPHSHNYLLDFGAYGGFIAIACFIIFVCLVARYVRTKQYEHRGVILTAFIFAFLLAMVFEYPNGSEFAWMIFASASALREKEVSKHRLTESKAKIGWSLNI